MSRARANVRIKFYLALFAAGIVLSGTLVGLELGRRLSVSADFSGLTLTEEEREELTRQGVTLDANDNVVPPAGELRPLAPIDLSGANPFKATSIQEIILKTIPTFLLGFVGLIAIVVFFINALRYIFSAGNADATDEAKTGMLYAAIGAIVVVLSYTIINEASQLLSK